MVPRLDLTVLLITTLQETFSKQKCMEVKPCATLVSTPEVQ